MKKSGTFLILIASITGISGVVSASSLLVPTSFPKTFDDVNFVDKMQIKASDYDRFSQLTPYEQLILDTTDANAHEEIDNDLQKEPPVEEPPIVQPDENPPIVQPGENPPATSHGGYCVERHPGIPANQKIPFGSPLLHEDFVYCSPYAKLNRGSGCRIHSGYDIGCTRQSFDRPIFTPADGVVEFIKPNRAGGSAGNYVIIDHGHGFKTWYLHLNQILVTKGQKVSAGCKIATVGNTGASLETRNPNNPDPRFSQDMSHLHYEIHYTGPLTSVTTYTGKTLAITHGFPEAKSQSVRTTIDPTQFLCVYANFKYGYCGKTFPYVQCK